MLIVYADAYLTGIELCHAAVGETDQKGIVLQQVQHLGGHRLFAGGEDVNSLAQHEGAALVAFKDRRGVRGLCVFRESVEDARRQAATASSSASASSTPR